MAKPKGQMIRLSHCDKIFSGVRSALALVIAVSFVSVLSGCNDIGDSNAIVPIDNLIDSKASIGEVLDSIKQLDDPYTVENMRAALNSLSKQNQVPAARATSLEQQIQANAIYVRFLPYGKRQKDALRKAMGDIPIFDHPLDYKHENRWKQWVDPTLPESTYAYYATVPVDFAFLDSIPFEKIKTLFLVQPVLAAQDVDSSVALARTSAASAIASSFENAGINLAMLEITSRSLTGNRIPEKNIAGRTSAWYSKWRPTGTITYTDDVLGTKPVVGVRVTAGYSYYWRSSTTDGNGYFVSPERWTLSCEYELHWDAPDFLMENGNSSYGEDLMIQGPTNYQPWNKHLSGKDAKHAAIFAAARYYYYGNIDGLERPRLNGWTSVALDLQIYDSDHPGNKMASYEFAYTWGTWAEYINIWLKENNSHLSTDNLYGSTIHELAHAAHYEHFNTRYTWSSRGGEFSSYIDKSLKESWARGVQRYLTRKLYPSYTIGYNNVYTGIVEDLIDDGGSYANNSGVGDAVKGFTIAQIQAKILSSFTLGELRSNLIASYPSGSDGRLYTESSMTNLFDHWTSVSGWK